MDFEDYNADMEKYCQEAEDAVNETTTAVDDSREKVYLDDYNAGLERYCRDAVATAESIDITPAEETELFSKFYKQQELSEEAQNAKNKIIEANLNLAIALATKFARSREMPRDELVSEANLALITAVNKYNPAFKPGRFRSYAASVIIHALKKYCWERNRLIHVPSGEVREMYILYKAEEKLRIELHRDPTTEELAEACSMTVKHVRHLRNTPFDTESYDAILPNSGTSSHESEDEEPPQMLNETLPEHNEEKIHFPPSTRVTLHDSLVILRKELKKLDKFQYEVIKYRFNLGRYKGNTSFEEQRLSLQDICFMLNATKGLVIKTKYAALRKLRQNMIDDFKEEFDVVRITPRLLNEVLAAERAAERAGQF